MPLQTQLSIFVENKVGSFFELCTALSEAKVNILGCLVSDDVDWGVVRLVVSDVAKAKDVLEQFGYVYGENDVVVLHLTNEPGALAAVAKKLSNEKISIEYSYATGEGDKALIVLATNNNENAERVISGEL